VETIMKALLIPTEQHDLMASVLEAALQVARKFDSYIEGFALRPAIDNFAAMDPVSSMAVATVRQHDEEAAEQARLLFDTFMKDRGVPRAHSAGPKLACGWHDTAPDGDDFVGSYGRVFDLTILGQPGHEAQSPRMATLETALFESGRPVLIAPSSVPARLGENVLIAWNCSTEQARTTAFAMPLLCAAKQVTVLTVEGGTVPGPPGARLVDMLERHCIPAKAVTLPLGRRTSGETILAHAQSLGCDLLVKGAYTQSRLRQMIFGGATRHILAHANLPVLMAH
jgi:nucleotide-binding universal stress UspA family protein